jgi:hypothetical protein
MVQVQRSVEVVPLPAPTVVVVNVEVVAKRVVPGIGHWRCVATPNGLKEFAPPAAFRPRPRRVGSMGDCDIDPTPGSGNANNQSSGGPQDRQEWVRANFTQIFGTSAKDLQVQGINPRQYARGHRDEIRRFAQMQRSHGIAVPSGRASAGGRPDSSGPNANRPPYRGYGYGGGGRFGTGMRGGTAWLGILLALFALRFLLVDSFVGTHAAIFWVLGIGGILLVARVVLFTWVRKRRFDRRQSGGREGGQGGFSSHER